MPVEPGILGASDALFRSQSALPLSRIVVGRESVCVRSSADGVVTGAVCMHMLGVDVVDLDHVT